MKNKVLIVTTTPYMIRQFLMNDIKILQNLGYEVEVATNFKNFNVIDDNSLQEFKNKLNDLEVKINQIDFPRSIGKIKEMFKANIKLLHLLDKKEYCFVHCHTPIASAIARLVCKRTNTKCIYTAHGFHFFKGAPIKNWLIFYPIEKWLTGYTDVLITINKEDYNRAKRKFKMKKLEYIPGIGVDIEKFQLKGFDRELYRNKLGLKKDDFAILSVGELNRNKNHEQVIRSIAKLNNRHIHYFIAGQGDLRDYLYDLADNLNIKNQVHLLGFRKDIKELNHSSDLFILPSIREGLNVSLMEAMACGLPCIANKIRGNVDLIDNEKGGYLIEKNNLIELSNSIKKIKNSNNIEMGRHNQNKINLFSKETVLEELENLYIAVLNI